ncbi:MAG: tetratricopeptide repeat protein [Gammaproteobacteria bacterium]|nr:tetratricopeptide repeat protein [Gammaproteobacteria bacterium]
MSETNGFFSQLAKRRIPQYLGIFLAGSWTALEFTQWAVGRYSLSPNWEEVLVVFLLLCLPLILVLAWHHGAPGKQQWNLFEKLFIPLYVLAIPAVLYHLYQDEDLGKTVDTVMMTDASGNTQQRVVARSQYLKPIAIFPFENVSNDKSLDPVAIITSEVLHRDLRQNIFYSSLDIQALETNLERAKFSGGRLPLTLQINIAKEKARQFFINGKLDYKDSNYTLSANLYNAKSGKQLTQFKASNSNYFTAIDSITEQANAYMEANNHDFTDLPIEDLYTNNWPAFLEYAKAYSIQLFGDEKAAADPLYAKAIELDETFSQAAMRYALFLLRFKGVQSAQKYTELAQKHQNYRLTERERFAVNATNYFFSKNLDKAFETLEQWSKLYPNEYESYAFKANFSSFSQQHSKAIENWLKVIELDPSQINLWDAIGDTYTTLGQYDKAVEAYEEHRKHHPNLPLSYKNLGDLYSKTGQFDAAISNFQKALSIDPNYSNGLRELAKAYARSGDYENAEEHYLKAINQSDTPNEEFSARINLASFYWEYGKLKEATKIYQEAYQFFSEKFSPTEAARAEANRAWRYYKAGYPELAQEVIDKAYAAATDEEIILINVQVAHALLLNEQGKANEALPLYDNVAKVAREYLKDGNDLQINYFKSQSLYSLGEHQAALNGFEAINSIFPDQIEILVWLGKNYLALNNDQEAGTYIRQVNKIAPGYPETALIMAKLMLMEDNQTSAKEYLQKALEQWKNADMEFAEILELKALLASL